MDHGDAYVERFKRTPASAPAPTTDGWALPEECPGGCGALLAADQVACGVCVPDDDLEPELPAGWPPALQEKLRFARWLYQTGRLHEWI